MGTVCVGGWGLLATLTESGSGINELVQNTCRLCCLAYDVSCTMQSHNYVAIGNIPRPLAETLYRTRALLGAPACISTRSKWAPNKEPAPINENRLVSFIEMTTFTSFVYLPITRRL